MKNEISDFQLDQLKEIINIGASHASTALSQMIKREVMIKVPESYVDRIEKVNGFIGATDNKATAVLFKIYGDVDGIMFFMFTDVCASKLARILTQECCASEVGNKEMEKSAIREVGNVLAGAALSSFSKFLEMSLLHSVTDVVNETESAIVNTVAAEIGETADDALVLKVNFSVKEEDIDTDLFFFIGPKTTKQLLEKMSEKYSS